MAPLFAILLRVFEDLRFVGSYSPVADGVDLHFDDTGLIDEYTVMIRPLSAPVGLRDADWSQLPRHLGDAAGTDLKPSRLAPVAFQVFSGRQGDQDVLVAQADQRAGGVEDQPLVGELERSARAPARGSGRVRDTAATMAGAGSGVKGAARSPDGIPLAFEVRGSGAPALVFVHGWSCDRRYWDPQLDAFAARHLAVAVDLAGHGESGAGRRRWVMPAFGDDVVAVVRHLGLDRVVLVGHSMGGDVALEAARRLGDQVAGVVWVDTYDTLGDPPTGQELQAFLGPFREDFAAATRALVRRLCGPTTAPDLVEWVAADMSAAPPEVALDALAHAVGNEPAVVAALGELACPVVAINAGWRPTDAAALGRHGVGAVVLPGAGHFLMLEDPDGFNRLLAEVVDGFAYGTTPGNT